MNFPYNENFNPGCLNLIYSETQTKGRMLLRILFDENRPLLLKFSIAFCPKSKFYCR